MTLTPICTNPRTCTALLTLALLCGCASTPRELHVEGLDATRDIRVITHASLAEVDRMCRQLGYQAAPYPLAVIQGCALHGNGLCTVHIQAPQDSADDALRVLGHETMHCLIGDWHDDAQPVPVSAVLRHATEPAE